MLGSEKVAATNFSKKTIKNKRLKKQRNIIKKFIKQ